MTLRPLGARVIVKRQETPTQTIRGIILTAKSVDEPVQGQVISVGPGQRTSQGKLLYPEVKKGDYVLFGKYAGNEVEVESEKLLIMNEEDILGVLA